MGCPMFGISSIVGVAQRALYIIILPAPGVGEVWGASAFRIPFWGFFLQPRLLKLDFQDEY